MDVRWTIELLGGLRATQGERVVTRFRSQRTGALLAYLAYHLHRSHPRDLLIELLWPESETEAGRHSLSMALSSLRHQFEPPGIAAGAVIAADRNTVGLNPAVVTTDVAEFEAALRVGTPAEGELERVQRLTTAVELYRGELLPGYYEEWVLQERERLAECYQQALQQLIRHLEASRDFSRALDYARRAVGADPLREEAHLDLMRLLLACGQAGAALQQYRELERILREELGATPSAAARFLADEATEPGFQTLSPPGDSAADESSEFASLAPSPSAPGLQASLSPPTGTVTFLLAEMEAPSPSDEPARGPGTRAAGGYPRSGWTPFASARGAATRATYLWRLHRELVSRGGCVVKEARGWILTAFSRASDAAAAAVAGQRAVSGGQGSGARGTSLRMALHTGEAEIEEEGYRSVALDHTVTLLLAAHGGQILCSEAVAALLRSEREPGKGGIGLTDLGIYRLRGAAADAPGASLSPERLFQLIYPEMARREFPPPKAELFSSGNLPLQFTRFFGRESESDRLKDLLLAPDTRLITLSGAGGIGKTRLALHVAQELRETLGGAVWFVPLLDLADPFLIYDKVIDGLRLPRSGQVEPLELIASALSSQPSLLVLDNFEHLVTGGAPLVRELLERVETLTVLVTSRRRLGLSGEREVAVPPLPTPDHAGTLEQLARNESVRLFVDRAQAVRADFQVTQANALAVATLCQQLEGIPLALVLAAARVQVLPPAQILAHLQHRFDFLVSRERDADARHRTLRAALDWSYRFLSPELQRFFARLSVFRGGWTAEAAAAVCGEDGVQVWAPRGTSGRCSGVQDGMPSEPERLNAQDHRQKAPAVPPERLTLDFLAQLQECSLVLAEERNEVMRFRMLETLREYGHEQLMPAELAELRRRHALYFLERAVQSYWLNGLEAEHDNLRAAFLFFVQSDDADHGLQMGWELLPLWRDRWSDIEQARRRLNYLLALPPQAPTLERSHGLGAAGLLARSQRDYREAIRLTEEALAIERRLGRGNGIAGGLCGLGSLAYDLGDYDRARALLQESLALGRTLEEPDFVRWPLQELADLEQSQGNYELARAYLEEALELHRRFGDPMEITAALAGLGSFARERGDYDRARALLQEGLALARTAMERNFVRWPLKELGILERLQENYEVARVYLEESLEFHRQHGDPTEIAWSLEHLGSLARDLGDYHRARALLQESVALARTLKDRNSVRGPLQQLGILERLQGNYGAARAYLEESLELRRRIDGPAEVAGCLMRLAWVSLSTGDLPAAKAVFLKSLRLWEEKADRIGRGYCLYGLAEVARWQGAGVEARSRLDESLSIFQGMGHRRGVAYALHLLGSLAREEGDLKEARVRLEESMAMFQELGDQRGLLECSDELAALAHAEQQSARAARLLGATAARREAIGAPLPPVAQPARADLLASLRESLGEARFQEAWEAGRALPWEEAVAAARRQDEATQGGPLPSVSDAGSFGGHSHETLTTTNPSS